MDQRSHVEVRATEALQRSVLFNGLGADDLRVLASAARETCYARHQQLAAAGNEWPDVLFVGQGALRLFRSSCDGGEITLSGFEVGEFCGLSSSWPGVMSHSLLEATTEPTQLYTFPRAVMHQFLHRHPAIGVQALEIAGARLTQLHSRLEALVFHDVQTRLAHELAAQARHGAQRSVFATHEELAAWIGSTQVVVTRTLRTLREAHLIESTPRCRGITVPDPDRLAASE